MPAFIRNVQFKRNGYFIFLFRYFGIIDEPNFKRLWSKKAYCYLQLLQSNIVVHNNCMNWSTKAYSFYNNYCFNAGVTK